jgi:hypothetical protein
MPDAVVDRFTGRRLDAMHGWKPSDADVKALVAALQRRGLGAAT